MGTGMFHVARRRFPLLKPRFHGRANPLCSSGEQLEASKTSALLASWDGIHQCFYNFSVFFLSFF
jgi:hypothetical protein